MISDRMTSAELRATLDAPAKPKSRLWSYATPTHCRQGHRHASKLEARVCDRVVREAEEEGARLYQQVRFPLLAIAPDAHGKALNQSIDFVLVYPGGRIRLMDAKGRQSREWARGARALEATLGILGTKGARVEEVRK